MMVWTLQKIAIDFDSSCDLKIFFSAFTVLIPSIKVSFKNWELEKEFSVFFVYSVARVFVGTKISKDANNFYFLL